MAGRSFCCESPGLLVELRRSPRRPVRLAAQVTSRLLSLARVLPSPLPPVDRYLYCSEFIRVDQILAGAPGTPDAALRRVA